jgi:hypothetical protein
MPVTDEELASARNLSAGLVGELRRSRGTTNDALLVMPEGALRRAVQKLAYPDAPSLRAEFRARQEAGADRRRAVAVVPEPTARQSVAGVPTATVPGVLPAASWKWLGPGNIGGRTRAIVVDPGRPTRIWAASAGGGVWVTVDGGGSWAPASDFLASLACSSLLLVPAATPGDHPTLLVGTGEGFGNVDALPGAGIFITTDGVDWAVLPATQQAEFGWVNRMALTAAGVLLVATPAGLLRSADPARTQWSLVIADPMADVKADPRGNGRLVAAGLLGAVWRTEDDGLTWARATADADWLSRVELAYAVANPDIVYASVNRNQGEIWRSADGGRTYRHRRNRPALAPPGQNTTAHYLGKQGWYDNAVWCGDPADPDLLLVGGINLWRSTDGGDTLAEVSTWWAHPNSAHADQHVIVSHPGYDGQQNRTVYFGNDGGVCMAADLDAVGRDAALPFTTGWTELANNFGATQFYAGAGSPATGTIIGGAQDNGTLLFGPAAGSEGWTVLSGGDGGWCAIDQTDPRFLYGEYVFLDIHRNTDGGATSHTMGDRYISGQFWNTTIGAYDFKPAPFRIPDAMPADPMQALFIAPFVLDPNEPNRILAGGRSLWRTDDARTPNTTSTGPSWTSIKAPIGSPAVRNFEISALAIVAGDSDSVWVGHTHGAVFHTTDGTAAAPTWQQIGTGILPAAYCSRILAQPGVVFIAFAAHQHGNLWRSRDDGRTWEDVSASLPAVPVRAVVQHPRRPEFVYAGTEIGLFASDDGGTTFTATNQGPTNCSVDDLFWMGEQLVSVTHGRGMFRIDLSH